VETVDVDGVKTVETVETVYGVETVETVCPFPPDLDPPDPCLRHSPRRLWMLRSFRLFVLNAHRLHL
jgi:hypothetical protein